MMTLSQMLADPSAPAWAQAVLSGLAIVASGAFAVIVPQLDRDRERRRASAGRLKITANTYREDVLRIFVEYIPEERSAGVMARISVLEPANLVFFEKFGGGVRDRIAGTVTPQSLPELQTLSRTIQLRFETDRQIYGDSVGCAVFLVPNNGEQWDRKARIRVQAWTDVAPKLLSERTLYVSPFQY